MDENKKTTEAPDRETEIANDLDSQKLKDFFTYADEDYAIYFKKDNTDLLNKVNAALEELIADGTLKSIVDKYIPA